MSVKLAPQLNDAPFVDSNGNPASGYRVFFYVAGSSTKQNAYTTSAGSVAVSNPVTLNASGFPAVSGNIVGIWLTAGATYDIGLAIPGSDDPPASFVRLYEDVTGINDTSTAPDQWVSGATPTYVSATSFTLVGDQTSTYHVGRRLKTTNSGGTVYGVITASTFGATTSVTMANDAAASLDSGLSAVSYSLLSAVNPSFSPDMGNRKGTAVASAATTNIWGIAGDYVHITGNTGPITSFGTAPYAGAERTLIFDSTPTITHNATTLILPGGASIVAAAGDRAIVRADTTANMIVVDFWRAASEPLAYATQAQQETGTSLVVAVSPGRQQFHPSAAKAWCMFNGATVGTNAPTVGYNVTSVQRVSAGTYAINLTTAMSSTTYVVVGTVQAAGGGGAGGLGVVTSSSTTASVINLVTTDINIGGASQAVADFTKVYVVAYGDQ